MKKCFKCNVNINSNTDDCPLCKTPLSSKQKGNDVFPIIITKYKNHYMIYKILLTLSIIGTVSTITINYLVNRNLVLFCHKRNSFFFGYICSRDEKKTLYIKILIYRI